MSQEQAPTPPPRKRSSKVPLHESKSVDSSLSSHGTGMYPKHFYEEIDILPRRPNSPSPYTRSPRAARSPNVTRKDLPLHPPHYKQKLQLSLSVDSSALELERQKGLMTPPNSSISKGRRSPLANEYLQDKTSLGSAQGRGRQRMRDYKEFVQLNMMAGSTEEDGGISLKELVRDHSKSFPVSVQVVKGDGRSVKNGDIFNIHFVKNTKVVTVVDMTDCKYTVPFNSAAKFSIVYSPQGTYNESKIFDTAGDLIQCAATERPKVVMATRNIKGEDGKSLLVEKNELLAIQQIKTSKFGLSHKLCVFSLTNHCSKMIPYRALGRFTTDPFKCRLFLPELVQNVPDLFPTKARIYFSLDDENPLSDELKREVITLQEESTISTLVTTVCKDKPSAEQVNDDKPAEQVQQVLKAAELSLELDIKVSIITSSFGQDEDKFGRREDHLYDDTMTLMRNYRSDQSHTTPSSSDSRETPSKSDQCSEYLIPETSSLRNKAQTFLLRQLRSGHERTGVSIEQPPATLITAANGTSPVSKEPPKPQQNLSSSADSKDCPTSPEVVPPAVENDYQPLIFDKSGSNSTNGNSEYQQLNTVTSTHKTQVPTNSQLYAKITEFPPALNYPIRPPTTTVATSSPKKSDTPKPPPLPVRPHPPLGKKPHPLPHLSLSTGETPPPISPRTRARQQHDEMVELFVSPQTQPTLSPTATPTDTTSFAIPTIRSAPPSTLSSPKKLETTKKTSLDFTDVGELVQDTPPNVRQKVCINKNNEDGTVVTEETKSSTVELEMLKTRCSKLEEEVERLKKEMKQVLQKMDLLQERPVSPSSPLSSESEIMDDSQRKANILHLRALDEERVLQMLEAMNLNQYTDVFKDQHVDGVILSQCNDDTLQVELGIVSKIHRLRLMQLILGKSSVRNLFSSDEGF